MRISSRIALFLLTRRSQSNNFSNNVKCELTPSILERFFSSINDLRDREEFEKKELALRSVFVFHGKNMNPN